MGQVQRKHLRDADANTSSGSNGGGPAGGVRGSGGGKRPNCRDV